MEKILKPVKIVLGIETSTITGSLAIIKNGSVMISYQFKEFEIISQNLLLKLSELIFRSGLNLMDIDLIVVATGPGSLTGIRIGISVSKALGKGLEVDCLGVSVLTALCGLGEDNKDNLCIVRAGPGKFYWQICNREENFEIQSGTIEFLSRQIKNSGEVKVICLEDVAGMIEPIQTPRVVNNLAEAVALKGLEIWSAGQRKRVSPIYVNEENYRKLEGN